jgi:hypothetical protein
MRTLAVLAFILALGLGEWLISHIQPYFWPLAAIVATAVATAAVLWAWDNRPGRSSRDAAYARRHMVQR